MQIDWFKQENTRIYRSKRISIRKPNHEVTLLLISASLFQKFRDSSARFITNPDEIKHGLYFKIQTITSRVWSFFTLFLEDYFQNGS